MADEKTCSICGHGGDIEEATLTLEGQKYTLNLCVDDRGKVARPFLRYGNVASPRRSSPEGHAVKPFTFRPGK